MPDIYSDGWYEAVRDTINARVATLPAVVERIA